MIKAGRRINREANDKICVDLHAIARR